MKMTERSLYLTKKKKERIFWLSEASLIVFRKNASNLVS